MQKQSMQKSSTAALSVRQLKTEDEVAQLIKEKEMTTGKFGSSFITKDASGVMRSVKLTLEGGRLVVNGRTLLDMASITVMSLSKQ